MLDHDDAGDAVSLIVLECHVLILLDHWLLSSFQPLSPLLGSFLPVLLFFLDQILDSFLLDTMSKCTTLCSDPLYWFDVWSPFKIEGFISLTHASLVCLLGFFQRFCMLHVEARFDLLYRVLFKTKLMDYCLMFAWLWILLSWQLRHAFRSLWSIENSFIHPEVRVDLTRL